MRYGIRGVAVTYGQLAWRKLDGQLFYMKIAPRALSIPETVPLFLMHEAAEEVDGADVVFHDTDDALNFSALLPRTNQGELAVSGVRSGKLAGASIALHFEEFEKEEVDGSLVVTVRRARLTELSLVDQPALRSSSIELCSPVTVRADRSIALANACRYRLTTVGW
jgi:phage head maturation protease